MCVCACAHVHRAADLSRPNPNAGSPMPSAWWPQAVVDQLGIKRSRDSVPLSIPNPMLSHPCPVCGGRRWWWTSWTSSAARPRSHRTRHTSWRRWVGQGAPSGPLAHMTPQGAVQCRGPPASCTHPPTKSSAAPCTCMAHAPLHPHNPICLTAPAGGSSAGGPQQRAPTHHQAGLHKHHARAWPRAATPAQPHVLAYPCSLLASGSACCTHSGARDVGTVSSSSHHNTSISTRRRWRPQSASSASTHSCRTRCGAR